MNEESNEVKIAKMAISVERILKLLDGNGHPGIVNRVIKIENSLDNHLCEDKEEKEKKEKEEDDQKRFKQAITISAIGIIMTNVLSIVFSLIK